MKNAAGAARRGGRLAELFFRVAGRLEGSLEAALGEVGLSIPSLLALKQLVETGEPIPLGQLAARIACAKSHMTHVADQLEADGWVARVQDPNDRRSVLAELTAQGRRRYGEGLEAVRRVEREFLGRLSREERGAFLAALERLVEE